MQDTQSRIKTFLSRFFGNHELNEDEDMQLVLFIEQEFQVNIENEDLDFDNFRTINAIVRLLDRKTAVTASH
jgi:methoxymalonate biosynthesis acyl carrier protein